jgi:hypothetical protein
LAVDKRNGRIFAARTLPRKRAGEPPKASSTAAGVSASKKTTDFPQAAR